MNTTKTLELTWNEKKQFCDHEIWTETERVEVGDIDPTFLAEVLRDHPTITKITLAGAVPADDHEAYKTFAQAHGIEFVYNAS